MIMRTIAFVGASGTGKSHRAGVVAAKNGEKVGAVVTYYTENDNENSKIVEINVEGADMSRAKIYRVDENNMYTPYHKTVFEDGKLTIRMERNTILYIEA